MVANIALLTSYCPGDSLIKRLCLERKHQRWANSWLGYFLRKHFQVFWGISSTWEGTLMWEESSRGGFRRWRSHPRSSGVSRTEGGGCQWGLEGAQSMRESPYRDTAVSVLLHCSTKEKSWWVVQGRTWKIYHHLERGSSEFHLPKRTQQEQDFSVRSQSCRPHFPTESLCDVFLFHVVNYCAVMYCCFCLIFFSPMSQSQHSRDVVWHHTKLILFTNVDSETFEWGHTS